MNTDTLLQIEQLHIDFVGNEGVVHAIQDLNLSLKKGETIGIVGESGSGKSVTSLAIMGLLPPQGKISKGAIHFNNKQNHNKLLNNLTEKEAFDKLVQYFFGENMNQEVESQSGNVHYPHHSKFITNMPLWFAKRISGYVRDEKIDYQKELEVYAIENNIKLKKD